MKVPTQEELKDICWAMPKLAMSDTLYYPGGDPVLFQHHANVDRAITKYYKEDRSTLSESDIEFIKQYIVYYINAPIFQNWAKIPDETKIKAINIKTTEDINDCLFDLLEVGFDPF